jgi:hypothetical protein
MEQYFIALGDQSLVPHGGGSMSARSQGVVPKLAFAFIFAFQVALVLPGATAFAQTRQGDYDSYRQQGYSHSDANRRALEKEAERDRWHAEQTVEEKRRVAKARATWEKQPPLAASRNPLLGKWQLQRASGGSPNSIFALGTALDTLTTCGDNVIEFRETVRADASGRTLDQVSYRGGGNQVAVLGARVEPLMVFEFVDPNRIRYRLICNYARVGPANTVAARAGTPAASADVVAPDAPARVPAGGGIANLGVNFGDSLDVVRQNLAARRVSQVPGRHNGDHYRLVAMGEFPGIDRRVNRIAYEFDAPESPAARLIGVVISYARDGAAQSAVYSERVATMSKHYPLAPQSPTQMQANVAGMTVSLIDDNRFSSVHEIYRKR